MKALIYIENADKKISSHIICDSAIIRAKDPFFIPDEREWRIKTLHGVRIDRLGKGIKKKFAERYYSECLTGAHPYAVNPADMDAARYGRDGALVIGEFKDADSLSAEFKQKIDELIEFFSDNITLKTGDLIFLYIENSKKEDITIDHRSYDVEIAGIEGCPPMRLKIR